MLYRAVNIVVKSTLGQSDGQLRIGGTVYTTRRSPFANTSEFRKGVIAKIEYDKDNKVSLIWCYFGKKYGHEAFEYADLNVCLFLDKNFIEK